MKNIKKTLHFALCPILLLILMIGCKKPMVEITDPIYPRLFSPIGVSAVVNNVTNVDITWVAVNNAKGYIIELSQPDDPTFVDALAETLDGEIVTKSYSGLMESVTYYFRIKAIGANISESNWRGTTFKTIPPPPPVTVSWNFSEQIYVDSLTTAAFTDTKIVGGITFFGGGSSLQMKTITEASMDELTFTYKLDLGGGGSSGASDNVPTKRYIQFHIDKPAVVTVYAISGGAGRTLKLVDGSNNLQGSLLLNNTDLTPMLVNLEAAGDYKIFSAGSGIGVCGIKAVIGGAYVKDNNPHLQNLTISGVAGLRDGEGDIDPEHPLNTLLPSFDPETLTYDYYVARSVVQLSINASKGHAKQVVTGDGVKSITATETSFPVKVLAEDGTSTLTYTINVHRQTEKSNDATLKTLSVSSGSLTPDFDPEITEYVDSVSNSVESLTITGVVNHPFAFTLGSISAENLVVGENGPYTITVVAEDHSTKEYKVTVVRKAPEGGQIDPIIYNFSAEPFLTELASYVGSKLITTNLTVNGVTFLADGTGNEMTYNTKSLSSADGLYTFTHRIGTEGSGNTIKRSIKFSVDGPCTITVYSESNSASDTRGIKIFNTTETLFTEESVFLGGPAKKHEYVYTGAAGDLYVTSSTSASNIYLIQIQY